MVPVTTPRVLTVSGAAAAIGSGGGCLALTLLVPPDRSSALDLLVLLPASLGLAVTLVALARRPPQQRVGTADQVTLLRVVLVSVVAGWAVLVMLGSLPSTAWLLTAVATVALVLDGVDGAVARRSGRVTEAGARLDAETDAAMMLALSVIVAHHVGAWIVLAGALRYVFGLTWMLRWSRRPRGAPTQGRFRRVVAATSAGGLAAATAPVLPEPLAVLVCGAALGLLLVSFGLDVLALEVAG